MRTWWILLLAAHSLLAGVYESQVQPVLARACVKCHNATARSGGLSLATPEAAKRVLANGRIVEMVSGEKPRMPVGGPALTPAEVAAIKTWAVESGWTPEWWSLKPLTKPAVPDSKHPWVRTPIDAFILATLREKKLKPSADADRRTLIRRLTYDLHGLPPTAAEIRAFETDRSADAYERLVDRLLESPRYGERWARHWLDVVHYGESHGYDKDKPRSNAWPYRDWVIKAFNDDKPYARFVQEQLAGDVLWPEDPQATVATGFLAAGPWDFVGHVELFEHTVNKDITRNLDRDDVVTQTASSMLSMTVQCARCHDHKFDPIPQEDYYKLQAVFAGVDRADRAYDDDPAVFQKRKELLAERREIVANLLPVLESLDMLREKIQAPTRAERDEKALAALDERAREWKKSLDARLATLDKKIAELPKPKYVYAGTNYFLPQSRFVFAPEPRPIHVLQRGSVESPGKEVGAGALSCVPGLQPSFPVKEEGSRRAALAQWITDPKNMLAWRSIVNRVWYHHFGAGIVDSLNDFGRMGSQPTHPELLDWLATTFQESGGSFKKLHRTIVTSSAYRQSSAGNAANAAIDAGNRYLWRMNRARLDAESLRDSLLAVSGRLDLTMGGPSQQQFWFKDDHSPVYDYAKFDPDSPSANRRSIYRMIIRSVPDPFMDRLDCPDASLISAKRNTTITAVQALVMMNDRFVLRQAEHLAEKSKTSSEAFQAILGREPDRAERAILDAYLKQNGMVNLCRLLFNSNEFLFVD